MFGGSLPLKLDTDELVLLFRIIPERKSGYRAYRDLLLGYYLIYADNITGTYILCKTMLFSSLDNYKDNELIFAFHLYNKSSAKFRLEIPEEPAKAKKKDF